MPCFLVDFASLFYDLSAGAAVSSVDAYPRDDHAFGALLAPDLLDLPSSTRSFSNAFATKLFALPEDALLSSPLQTSPLTDAFDDGSLSPVSFMGDLWSDGLTNTPDLIMGHKQLPTMFDQFDHPPMAMDGGRAWEPEDLTAFLDSGSVSPRGFETSDALSALFSVGFQLPPIPSFAIPATAPIVAAVISRPSEETEEEEEEAEDVDEEEYVEEKKSKRKVVSVAARVPKLKKLKGALPAAAEIKETFNGTRNTSIPAIDFEAPTMKRFVPTPS